MNTRASEFTDTENKALTETVVQNAYREILETNGITSLMRICQPMPESGDNEPKTPAPINYGM